MYLVLKMKYIFSTVLVVLLSSLANAEQQPKSIIPISISDVTSESWPEGGGVFRVISLNSEIEPCIYVESINLLESKFLVVKQVCPEDLKVKGVRYDGTQLAGFYYDKIKMADQQLLIEIDVFQNAGPSFQARCKADLAKTYIEDLVCEKL